MKRSPLVVAGTVVGLTGLFGFHTSPAKLNFGFATPPSIAGSSKAPVVTPSASPTGTRTATGPLVNYYFGTLSVSVTTTGSKITNVTIKSLSDGGNSLSQSIDQQSIPMLEAQALSAQSAKIQGVSGASYTSAGFAQSLQGALTQLKV